MKASSKRKVGVVGEGAWGTAIAIALANNGHEVVLWCHEQKNADEIVRTRVNSRYLKDVELSSAITPVTDFSQFSSCGWIAEAIPTQYLRPVLVAMQPFVSSDCKWIVLSKGFESDTFLFPAQIITDVFGSSAVYALVAGPTYAQELARGSVSAAVVASTDHQTSLEVVSLLQSNYFRLFIADDLIGVQTGSALKNVIALGLGMLEGAGYGHNTRAFFLTLGYREIVRIAESFGACPETLYGLSGLGDLVLTSYGGLSKNAFVGKKIGEGGTLDTILEKHGVIPEGVNTIFSLTSYAEKHSLSIPLVKAMSLVIEGRMKVKDLVDVLVSMD